MHVTINQFAKYTGRGRRLNKEIYMAYLSIAERDPKLMLTTAIIAKLDHVSEKEVLDKINGYS